MNSINGRVAIVTGASSGIGKGIAIELAREGVVTVLAARSEDKLRSLVDTISAGGGRAFAVPTDVTREEDVLRLFEETARQAGPPDILINNAGIADATPTDELSLDRWREVIDTNLTSAFLCAREALKAMKPRGRGRIINIGSLSAKSPRPDSAAYTASKFAIEGLTRSIALDAREFGVSATTLHPGATKSNLAPGASDKLEKDCLFPEDIGRLVVTFCQLPDDVTMLDALVTPIRVPFFGRG